eukprot:Selendium_serpulae@DN6412_c1_g3_i2.p1
MKRSTPNFGTFGFAICLLSFLEMMPNFTRVANRSIFLKVRFSQQALSRDLHIAAPILSQTRRPKIFPTRNSQFTLANGRPSSVWPFFSSSSLHHFSSIMPPPPPSSHPSAAASPSEWTPDVPLVSTAALATRLLAQQERAASPSGNRLWAVDGSFLKLVGRDAKREFEAIRIPGAVQFQLNVICDDASPYPNMLPSVSKMNKWLDSVEESHGVRPNPSADDFVVYDMLGAFGGPRVWWTLRGFGFARCFLLDGGFPKWVAEGRPTESTPLNKKAAPTGTNGDKENIRMATQFPKEEMVVDFDQVEKFSKTGKLVLPCGITPAPITLLDARAAPRFAQHIPLATNLPFADLLDEREYDLPEALAEVQEAGPSSGDKAVKAKYWTFKNVEDMKTIIYKKTKIDVDGLIKLGEVTDDSKLTERVVVSCNSGVTAVVLLFGLRLCGVPMSRLLVYDGSWSEWSAKACI